MKVGYTVGSKEPVLVADYLAKSFGLGTSTGFSEIHSFSRASLALHWITTAC